MINPIEKELSSIVTFLNNFDENDNATFGIDKFIIKQQQIKNKPCILNIEEEETKYVYGTKKCPSHVLIINHGLSCFHKMTLVCVYIFFQLYLLIDI